MPSTLSRRRRVSAVVGIVALSVSMLGGIGLSAAGTAVAAPGTPGTPQTGSVLYNEDFQNAPANSATKIGAYTSTSGATYTADATYSNTAWCNGVVYGQQTTNAAFSAASFCNSGWWPSARLIPNAMGQYAGAANPAANLAVAEQTVTGGGPYVGTMLQGSGINVPGGNRFVTFSLDVANFCDASSGNPALDRFYLLDGTTPIALNSSDYDVCTDPAARSFAVGGRSVKVGTFTGNQSALVTNTTIGFRLDNRQASGTGNDQALDNFRILDVSPQLDKAFSPAVVPTGGTSRLTFTITNTAELAAKTGWSFSDRLPAGLRLAATPGYTTTCAGASILGGTAGSTQIGVRGNLTAGQASCTVSVNVTSSTAGSFTNGPSNVGVTGMNLPGSTTVTFESPSLGLVKHARTPVDVNGNGITDAGDTIQYTFDVTNSGDVPVSALAITDPKAGATTCAATTLAVGASTTCAADTVYTVTSADAAGGSVDNTATATATSPSGAAVTSAASSTTTPAQAAAPSITLQKSASPTTADRFTAGQEITYSFTATNTGNVPLDNVAVDETGFTGTGTLSGVDCPATTLAVGGQFVCTATYTLTQADVDAGSVTNNAVATGTPRGSTTEVSATPSNVTIPTPAAPGLAVLKTASAGTVVAAGQDLTYAFRVTNTGNVTLNDVAVNEGNFTGAGELSAVSCTTTTLVPGQITTCTATYTLTQADIDTGGSIDNTATATGTVPAGNPITSTPSEVSIPVTQSSALSVVKSSDIDTAAVGDTVTYSFLVTNTGNTTVTDPTVTDDDFSGTGKLSAVSCPQGALSPGDDITCTATYTLTQADVDAGQITNVATVRGTGPGNTPLDGVPSNEVTVGTNAAPALTLTKTADADRVTEIGQTVTYSFLVRNTGNVTVTDPKITEGRFTGKGDLSAVTCPKAATSLAPGDTLTCTATYRIVATDLTAGGVLSNTATAVGTAPGGDSVASASSTAAVEEVAAATPSEPTPAPTGTPTATPTPGITPAPVVGGGTTPGGLAFTGTELIGPGIGLAIMLLTLGGGLLIVRRRKPHSTQDDNG